MSQNMRRKRLLVGKLFIITWKTERASSTFAVNRLVARLFQASLSFSLVSTAFRFFVSSRSASLLNSHFRTNVMCLGSWRLSGSIRSRGSYTVSERGNDTNRTAEPSLLHSTANHLMKRTCSTAITETRNHQQPPFWYRSPRPRNRPNPTSFWRQTEYLFGKAPLSRTAIIS